MVESSVAKKIQEYSFREDIPVNFDIDDESERLKFVNQLPHSQKYDPFSKIDKYEMVLGFPIDTPELISLASEIMEYYSTWLRRDMKYQFTEFLERAKKVLKD